MKFKTIIFDLDGTLADSALGIRSSCVAAFKELGLTPPAFDKIEIGPPIAGTLRQLLGSSAVRYEEVLLAYRKHYAQTGVYESSLYEGIAPLLAELFKLKFTLIVATAKLTKFAIQLLENKNIAEFFAGNIYGDLPNGEMQNKADLLRFIIQKLKLDPNSTLMVGDRRHDILAAQKNGLTVAGVSWGYGSRAELVEHAASFIVSSPQELRARILSGQRI